MGVVLMANTIPQNVPAAGLPSPLLFPAPFPLRSPLHGIANSTSGKIVLVHLKYR